MLNQTIKFLRPRKTDSVKLVIDAYVLWVYIFCASLTARYSLNQEIWSLGLNLILLLSYDRMIHTCIVKNFWFLDFLKHFRGFILVPIYAHSVRFFTSAFIYAVSFLRYVNYYALYISRFKPLEMLFKPLCASVSCFLYFPQHLVSFLSRRIYVFILLSCFVSLFRKGRFLIFINLLLLHIKKREESGP